MAFRATIHRCWARLMKPHRVVASAAVLCLSMLVSSVRSQSPPGNPPSEETPAPAALQTATAAFKAIGGTRLDDRYTTPGVLHRSMRGPFFSLPRTTTDDDVKKLPAIPFSFGLDVRTSKITDQGLALLADCPNLSRLDLVYVKEITDAGLAHLVRCKNLRYLNLNLNDRLTDIGLTNLSGCKKLAALCLLELSITDLGLKEFEKLPDLEYLELGNYGANPTKLTDAGFKSVFRCKKLTNLMAFKVLVTSDGLKELSNLENLTTLGLNWSAIEDAGAKEIGKCKRLRNLVLWEAKLSDAGLKELANLKDLETLDLTGTNITDASVETLSRMKGLRRLGLRNTALSDLAIFRVRVALPNCEIERPVVKLPAKGRI